MPDYLLISGCLGLQSQILGNLLGTKQLPFPMNLKALVQHFHVRSMINVDGSRDFEAVYVEMGEERAGGERQIERQNDNRVSVTWLGFSKRL